MRQKLELPKANLPYYLVFLLPHLLPAKHIFHALQIYGIDAASGAAILSLDVRPGDHVLDLCAAPGSYFSYNLFHVYVKHRFQYEMNYIRTNMLCFSLTAWVLQYRRTSFMHNNYRKTVRA